MAKALKNTYSNSSGTFDKIQKVLAENGAKKVMMDYSSDGKLESISFAVEMSGKIIGFRLPAMIDNVFEIMYGEQSRDSRYERFIPKWKDQAYKTAWANVRDWIDAQMALVKTRQVELVQVFLPYMVTKNDQTLYQQIVSDPKFLLE